MRAGGCQCGGLRYEVAGDPLDIYCCHCTECRKQSASVHGISVIVRLVDFKLTQGEPKVWRRSTDSGNVLECLFCPMCGTRVVHQDSNDSTAVSVKGGSFDEPFNLAGAKHIWTASKMPGVEIPAGVETWPGEPPD